MNNAASTKNVGALEALKWATPARNQGQIVETAYAWVGGERGDLVACRCDHSDRTIEYYIAAEDLDGAYPDIDTIAQMDGDSEIDWIKLEGLDFDEI